jgi:hypothetical protein
MLFLGSHPGAESSDNFGHLSINGPENVILTMAPFSGLHTSVELN